MSWCGFLKLLHLALAHFVALSFTVHHRTGPADAFTAAHVKIVAADLPVFWNINGSEKIIGCQQQDDIVVLGTDKVGTQFHVADTVYGAIGQIIVYQLLIDFIRVNDHIHRILAICPAVVICCRGKADAFCDGAAQL